MGRKIEMKKIEDNTRLQVTFSKRRTSLLKKAEEICLCCDADIAVVAFSPSGRLTKYCNHDRVENIIERYVSTPADQRFSEITNIQAKLEKLKEVADITGQEANLEHLQKQIEKTEICMRRNAIAVQIAEANLRDFELEPEKNPSLHQLSWCERNLLASLKKITDKKTLLPCSSTVDSEFSEPAEIFNQKWQSITGNEGRFNLFEYFGGNELYSGEDCSSMTGEPGNLTSWGDSYRYEPSFEKFRTHMDLMEGAADSSKRLHHHNLPYPDTTVSNSSSAGYQLLDNMCNFSSNVTYDMNRLGLSSAKDTYPEICIPTEVSPQSNFGAYIMPEYRLWEHSSLPLQQNYASCSTYDNLVQSYIVDGQPSYPESFNYLSMSAPVSSRTPEMAMPENSGASSSIACMVQHLNLCENNCPQTDSNYILKTNTEDRIQILSTPTSEVSSDLFPEFFGKDASRNQTTGMQDSEDFYLKNY